MVADTLTQRFGSPAELPAARHIDAPARSLGAVTILQAGGVLGIAPGPLRAQPGARTTSHTCIARAAPGYMSVSAATPRASSPTATYTSLVFLCAMAAHFGHTIVCDDIDNAYLLGRRSTTAYMSFPYGYADYMHFKYGRDRTLWPYDPKTHVLAVEGNIWGHPDAGAIWYNVIYPFLTNELGFVPTPLDPCLLVRWDDGVPTLLLLFVDDYFIAATVAIAWARPRNWKIILFLSGPYMRVFRPDGVFYSYKPHLSSRGSTNTMLAAVGGGQ